MSIREIIGFLLVIASAFPMGFAEGKLIDMNNHYTYTKVLPMVLLYFLSVGIYLLGFLQIPTKIGFIIGVWEIAAVTISVSTAIAKHNIKWDQEYSLYYFVLISATYVLGWAADKLFAKAGV